MFHDSVRQRLFIKLLHNSDSSSHHGAVKVLNDMEYADQKNRGKTCPQDYR